MATNWMSNEGKYQALLALKNLGLKLMLLSSAYTPDKDHTHVSDVVANEITATGYTGGYGGSGRKALSNVTVTKDNTNDRAYVSADPTVWTATGGAGTNPAYAAIIVETGGSDSTALVLGIVDAVATLTGGTLTITASATGLLRID